MECAPLALNIYARDRKARKTTETKNADTMLTRWGKIFPDLIKIKPKVSKTVAVPFKHALIVGSASVNVIARKLDSKERNIEE